MALTLAAKYGEKELLKGLAQQITGQPVVQNESKADLQESDNIKGMKRPEHSIVEKARTESHNASQPEGGEVIKEREGK